MKKIIPGLLALLLLNSFFDAGAQMAYEKIDAVYPKQAELQLSKHPRKVSVKWQTEGDKKIAWYFVQHSTDGKEWRVIGKVTPGLNNHTDSEYEYDHQKPLRGVNYYRLLMVDTAGYQGFSKVAAAQWYITRSSIQVQPNPAVRGVVSVKTPAAGTLQVFDSAGFFVKQLEAKAGSNSVDLSMMPRGIHYIKVGKEMTSVLLN